MNRLNLSDIIKSIVVTIIVGLLTWIALSVKDVPQLKDDNKNQHDRYDELIQQEIDKRIELEKQILILQTRLEK
jgi:hypothetical protein